MPMYEIDQFPPLEKYFTPIGKPIIVHEEQINGSKLCILAPMGCQYYDIGEKMDVYFPVQFYLLNKDKK